MSLIIENKITNDFVEFSKLDKNNEISIKIENYNELSAIFINKEQIQQIVDFLNSQLVK